MQKLAFTAGCLLKDQFVNDCLPCSRREDRFAARKLRPQTVQHPSNAITDFWTVPSQRSHRLQMTDELEGMPAPPSTLALRALDMVIKAAVANERARCAAIARRHTDGITIAKEILAEDDE